MIIFNQPWKQSIRTGLKRKREIKMRKGFQGSSCGTSCICRAFVPLSITFNMYEHPWTCTTSMNMKGYEGLSPVNHTIIGTCYNVSFRLRWAVILKSRGLCRDEPIICDQREKAGSRNQSSVLIPPRRTRPSWLHRPTTNWGRSPFCIFLGAKGTLEWSILPDYLYLYMDIMYIFTYLHIHITR